MWAAITALFTALANAAHAYVKYTEFQIKYLPHKEKKELENECEKIEDKIEELQHLGGDRNNQLAKWMRDTLLERRYNQIKFITTNFFHN